MINFILNMWLELSHWIIIAIFVLVTNPISSHAIARASNKSGVSLCDRSVVDQTKEFEERKEA